MNVESLHRRCILVVEDDALLAWSYEQMLEDAGADIVGPAATVEEAVHHAASPAIEAAVLDIRLGNEEVWPVARLLAKRDIPFVFCTGQFAEDTLPSEWSGRPVLTKPVSPDRVLGVLRELLTKSRA